MVDTYYESDEFKHRSEIFFVAVFTKVECACVCLFKVNQCLNIIGAVFKFN